MHIREYKDKTVHFIGIGGVSMSGLALMLLREGYTLTGSDQSESDAVRQLVAMGIPVVIGHKAESVEGASLVVRTAAVPDTNPEVAHARELGIPVMERGTLLGQIMQSYKDVMCVAGTHGKTTTSSMLSMALLQGGKDPTIHLGGSLPLINGTSYIGGREYFVAEACEYKDSFLRFFPTTAILLNIDNDHLDYFKDIDAIEASFRGFAGLVPETGYVLGNGDDPRVCRILDALGCERETFGYGENCTWRADGVGHVDGRHFFTLLHNGEKAAEVRLSVPGRHNVMNAMAAIAAAYHVGVDAQRAADILLNFTGAQRRFEKAGEYNGAAVFHDYAHHPTEIKATLNAARLMTKGKLYCVFQPHTYSRTKKLFDDFSHAFGDTDRTLLVDIYAAREADPGDVSSRLLAVAANKVSDAEVMYAESFDTAASLIRAWVQPGDTVITLGAGDIEKMSKLLVRP